MRTSIRRKAIAVMALAAIATLVAASFGAQPALAQPWQDKSKTPNYIRKKADPNNTCVTSGDDTKCATASVNGNAEVKIVENTLGTWYATTYHEMYTGTPGPPSSGFYIDTDGYNNFYAQFEVTLEGKVQIVKNGKTVEARYGMVMCNKHWLGGVWECDKAYYAKKTTDGTHTIPVGTKVITQTLVPWRDPGNQEHTLGSLFECKTTGTGTVLHTRCDAYDGDKYFKATKLRVSWPWL